MTIADQIEAWMIDHPGEHLCTEVARGVGRGDQVVRDALRLDARFMTRQRRMPGKGGVALVYSLFDVPDELRRPITAPTEALSPEEGVLRAAELARDGKNVDEIRDELRISLRTAWRYLRIAGVRPAPRKQHDASDSDWRRSVSLVMSESKRMTRFGYVAMYLPMHPNANTRGEVLEHRLVMERELGRLLQEDELVHHVNEVKTDNRVANLQVVSIAQHQRIHASRRLGPDGVRPGTQTASIIDALEYLGGRGSTRQIHQLVGPMRLNSRVAELRRRGFVIQCHHVGGRGTDAYEYELVSKPAPPVETSKEAAPGARSLPETGSAASSDASGSRDEGQDGASDDQQLSLPEAA